MRFQPDFSLHVFTEEEFPTQIKAVEATLAQYRTEGCLIGADDVSLYYEYFLCQDSKASIVVVHGLSEFTQKYYEFAYYMLNQGYNVFLYDQRGHGRSGRLTERVDLLHVDSFEDYGKDLGLFIETVVAPADDKPIYLYSHSMGGAVSALYLSGKNRAEKAILAAPMIEPYSGTLRPIAQAYIKQQLVRYGAKTKSAISKEFNPEASFRHSSDASESRFNHNMSLRLGNRMYQTTPISNSWVYQSLIYPTKTMPPRRIRRIQTPILLISAGMDTVVKNRAQERFAKHLSCVTRLIMPQAKHAILTADTQDIARHLQDVLDFFNR